MGFNENRRATVDALRDRRYEYEERDSLVEKNLLFTGQISPEEVADLLEKCRGTQYETRPHHFDQTVMVDIFKPTDGSNRWYIKSYLVDEGGVIAVFISVHL